jgi:hypothetical protein
MPVVNCTFAVLAEYATTSHDGKLSVISIFDQINTATLPAILPIFFVVARFEAGPAEFGLTKQVETVLMTQDGTELLRARQEATIIRPDIPGVPRTLNILNGIGALKFEAVGAYQFAILVDGRTEATIPLRVNVAGGQNAAGN